MVSDLSMLHSIGTIDASRNQYSECFEVSVLSIIYYRNFRVSLLLILLRIFKVSVLSIFQGIDTVNASRYQYYSYFKVSILSIFQGISTTNASPQGISIINSLRRQCSLHKWPNAPIQACSDS